MKMNLYPAIDLYEGQVVRLTKGDFAQKTVYSNDPASKAAEFENAGTPWIHMVDLEGAKTGILKNLKSLAAVRAKVKCKLQFGGGMRSVEAIKQALSAGADRIVVGTKALDPIFFKKILGQFGAKIAVGIDVKDDIVQTQGWLESSGLTLAKALEIFNEEGVETLIFTDISKDGMLQGPNFEKLDWVLKHSKSRVILSGGISTLEDIKKCSQIKAKNFEGPIIGKALYEKQFTLEQAVEIAKEV